MLKARRKGAAYIGAACSLTLDPHSSTWSKPWETIREPANAAHHITQVVWRLWSLLARISGRDADLAGQLQQGIDPAIKHA